MKKVLLLIALCTIMLGIIPSTQAASDTINYPVVVEDVKYIGYDTYLNLLHMQMTINVPSTTKLRIVENYYSYDSYGNPTMYSSGIVIDSVIDHKIVQDYYRPKDRYGTAYSLVETRVLINGTLHSLWFVDMRQYWK